MGCGGRWIAAVACVGIVVSVGFSVLKAQKHEQSPGPSSQAGSSALLLPPEVVLKMTSKNPRSEEVTENDEQVIDGISTALDHESDQDLDPAVEAALHGSLADTYRVSGNYEDAIEQYQFAIGLLREPGNETDRNWYLLSLVKLLIFLGRAEEAQANLGMILRNQALENSFVLDLGIAESQVYVILNEPDHALDQLRYTLGLLDTMADDDVGERIERMRTIAEMLIELGQHEEGVDLLHRARAQAVSELGEESLARAFVDVSLANALFDPDSISTSDQAKERILNAIHTFSMADDEFHATWASRQLGNIYLAIGDSQSAYELYEQAYLQMGALLGEDHHETIICLAYRELAQMARGNDVRLHREAYESAMASLEDILRKEHGVVRSIRDSEDRLHPD